MKSKIFALSVSINLGLGLSASAKAQTTQQVEYIKQESRNKDAQFISCYVAIPEYYIPQDAQISNLREEFRERFAGAYVIQLYPEQRITVHLSGNAPVASRKL